MRYLAVDLGSTHIKCALVDTGELSLRLLAHEPAPIPFRQEGGRHETDADALFAKVNALLCDALDAYPDIAGIGLCAQMHGCVLVDERGLPLTGLISWQDEMGLAMKPGGDCSYLDCLRSQLGDFPKANLLWPARKQALGNLYARVSQGLLRPEGARFLTAGGYIAWRLCGSNVTHASQAASTGCATADGRVWQSGVLRAAGLSEMDFPRIVTGYDPVGAFSYKGRDILVFPDIGDHQAGVLGSGARAEVDAQINIGTGGMVGIVTQCAAATGEYELRPLMGESYVRTITGLPGGRHLRILVQYMGAVAQWLTGAEIPEETLWRRAVEAPQVDTAIALEPVSGPIGLELSGFMDGKERPESLFVAFYRRVGAACAQAIARMGGAERIVYTGGAVLRNPAMRRAIRSACALPCVMAAKGEGALAGILRLMLLHEGLSLEQSARLMAGGIEEAL